MRASSRISSDTFNIAVFLLTHDLETPSFFAITSIALSEPLFLKSSVIIYIKVYHFDKSKEYTIFK